MGTPFTEKNSIEGFLNLLYAPYTSIMGIGTHYASLIEKLCGNNQIISLLYHLPTGTKEKLPIGNLVDTEKHAIAATFIKIDRHILNRSYLKWPQKVLGHDNTGIAELVFFNVPADHVEQRLKIGQEYVVVGSVKKTPKHHYQIVNPSLINSLDYYQKLPQFEAVYPLTAGLSQRNLQKFIQSVLAHIPDMPEWIDPQFLLKRQWPSWKQALLQIHFPPYPEIIDPSSSVRQRLAYDEILANQLAMQLIRKHYRTGYKPPLLLKTSLRPLILKKWGFQMTISQQKVVQEIEADLLSGKRLLRLLQGDVGSGKTIVGLMAMMMVVEAGYQSALLAPTEILAQQHYQKIAAILPPDGTCRVALITSSTANKQRQIILKELKEGKINILIGTHSLLENEVQFKSLELIVIDEQHRFGVHQRLILGSKGNQPNILVMTATPIPRTLALAIYGNIDVSILHEKPAGRLPIDTKAIRNERLPELVDRLKHMVKEGSKIFWVCPSIDETDSQLVAVKKRFEQLQKIFGPLIGLLHGQLKNIEKQQVLDNFTNGTLQILATTTIIEVGVDVAEADIMVIDDADKFGLSQLHQLRGRVGRNRRQSYCVLLYREPLSPIAKSRLEILVKTQDGFEIAEQDLKLRGSGDILGTQQSGFNVFKLVDIHSHHILFQPAHQQAKLVIQKDPFLKEGDGKNLRNLLHIFDKYRAIRIIDGI